MGGHHRRHALRGQLAEGQDVGGQFVGRARVFGQHMVAVAADKTVTGEMFAAGLHAAAV